MHPANPMWDSAAHFLSASAGSGRGDLHGHLSAALNGAQSRLSGAAEVYGIAIGSAQIGLPCRRLLATRRGRAQVAGRTELALVIELMIAATSFSTFGA
jgi:hypothetical protein